ncbi:chromate transporter [Microvirga pudoricolor]|uniref:chromate transporter n=1 Tax=Microvirga pudoricolor TaxID=2778729 RepID=UPI0019529493|nr:chromate transporter [Microvirga pudoricolor]MBM6596409.1 chromate transporter [Microvirga pudoricolor]
MTLSLPTTEPAARPGLVELALVFNKMTLASFGGGLSAWAQRLIVEDKRWLSDEEFLSAYTLARVMPGANQINFAIYVGNRFQGVPGAVAAVLGLTGIPFCIIVALGYAYVHYHSTPALQDILRGIAAGAIGLTFSMGLKTGEKFFRQPVALVFAALAFAGSIMLRMPLLAVLAILIPPAFLVAWRRPSRG